MKNIMIISALLAVVAVALYVGVSLRWNQESNGKDNVLTIGFVGPLTGPTSHVGIPELRGKEVAIEIYNQKRTSEMPEIRLVALDGKWDAKTGSEKLKELVETHKVKVIFFVNYALLDDIIKYAETENILFVNTHNNDSEIASLSDNLFLIAKKTPQLGTILAKDIIASGKKKVFLMYPENQPFYIRVKKGLEGYLSNFQGIQLLEYQYVKANRPDFKSYIQKGVDQNADAFVFFGHGEIGYAFKDARELGINSGIYSLNLVTSKQIQKKAQGGVEGVHFPFHTYLDGNRFLAKEFLNNYKKNFGEFPSIEWIAFQSYDGTAIVLNSIAEVYNSEGNFIKNLKRSLHRVQDYPGTSGDITISEDGSSSGIYHTLYKIENGEPVKQ